jgi:hypothetical protein
MDIDLDKLLENYRELGYAILPAPSLVPPHLHQLLLDAVERVTAKARKAQWTHRRTVGSPFPPFARQGDNRADVWGVQHLMHPELAEPIFASWYTSPIVRQVMKGFLGCSEEDLQMG